jgi:hypothetical protein
MTAFINPDFKALNVLEIDVDTAIISEFQALVQETAILQDFHIAHPQWASDIRWISPNTLDTFRYFQAQFMRLGITQHVLPFVDIETTVRMYSGFLVSRSECSAPNFHFDWVGTDSQAYTLLSPISEVPSEFGLLYKKFDGSIAQYPYKLGKALIIGAGFIHSTQPGRSPLPLTLLSYTFGSDKMKYWDNISSMVARQGNLFRQPDGKFVVRNFDCPDTLLKVSLQSR